MATSAHPNWDRLRREVIEAGLCTRCGACVGLSPPGLLRFADPLGACLPAREPGAAGDVPEAAVLACPGAAVDFPALNRALFGRLPEDFLLGQALAWHVAWAADESVRAAGASGGALTAVARHLLETGHVKGVACLVDHPDDPLLPRPVVATEFAALRLAQQSKYCLAPVLTVLREVAAFGAPVAVVGLPDQVHSLRRLQQLQHPAVANVRLLLGSYCGAVQHFTAITAFLRKHGVRDPGAVRKIEYRAGAWPGRLRVTLRDGSALELDKFYANYMTLLYSVERSLLCVDLTNELADISFGDAWAPRYEERHEGFSLLAVRTPAGREALDPCLRAGVLHAEPSSAADAAEMHSHGLYNKKVAVWGRMDLRRGLGRPVPRYGYVARRSGKQKAMGLAIALVFALGRTAPVRWLVGILPLELTGRVFLWVRKRWRSATRPKRARSVAGYRIELRPLDPPPQGGEA